jgi:hypothetical protein
MSFVLQPLTLFFRPQNLNTQNTKKCEYVEKEAAVTGGHEFHATIRFQVNSINEATGPFLQEFPA